MSYNGPSGGYAPYPPQSRPPQNGYGGPGQSSYGPSYDTSPNVGQSYGVNREAPPLHQQPYPPPPQQYQQHPPQYPNGPGSHFGADVRPPPARPPPDHGPGRGGQGGPGRRRKNRARSPLGRGGRPLGDRGQYDQQVNQGPPVRPAPPYPVAPNAVPAPPPRASEHSTVDARIAKERPCRTLFVRNITYETNTQDLLSRFEAFGPFQKVFDIIQRRGMLFLTYYDLRAAQKARDAMHNTVLGPRAIDVHYSLPKADELQGKCSRESNQGSVMCTLHLQRDLNEQSLRRCAADFGEVKAVLATSNPNQKVVEFYDSRAAVRFVDSMDTAVFGESRLHVDFVWDDVGEEAPPPPPAAGTMPPPSTRAYEAPANSRPYQSGPQYGQGSYAPAPSPAPPQAAAQNNFDRGPAPGGGRQDRDFEHRGGRPPHRSGEGPSYGEVRGYAPPPSGPPAGPPQSSHFPPRADAHDSRQRSDPRLSDRRGSGGPSRYDRGPPGPSPGPPLPGRYDAAGPTVPPNRRESMPPPAGRYDMAPPAAAPPADGKLEEARKIQQLLASLGGAVAAPTPPQQPAASTPHFSPMSQYPPLPSQSYGTPASSPYAPAQPTYSGPNPSHSTPQQNQPHYSPPAPVGAPAGVTIPPNVLSMMQAPSQAPPQQYGQSGGGYGSNPAPPPATSIGSLLQQLGGQR